MWAGADCGQASNRGLLAAAGLDVEFYERLF